MGSNPFPGENFSFKINIIFPAIMHTYRKKIIKYIYHVSVKIYRSYSSLILNKLGNKEFINFPKLD